MDEIAEAELREAEEAKNTKRQGGGGGSQRTDTDAILEDDDGDYDEFVS